MADFTNKAAMGTSRINPSSMVPGARGNAPQGGFRTQMKRSPSGGAEGSGGGQSAQFNQLAQQMMQNTAPQQGVAPSQAPVIPRVTIPTAPQSMIPQSLQNFHANPTASTYPNSVGGADLSAKMRSTNRVSSNPNGPTPIQHIPSGNWWDNPIGTAPQEQTPDSSFLGPWVMNNEPMRSSQSNLPPEKQQMLGTAKKGRSFKADDFNMLSAIFKTLGEQ